MSMQSMPSLKRPLALVMGKFFRGSCRASSCGWSRRGSSFTAMNWSRIGNWPSAARSPTRSHHCEVAMYWDVKVVKPLPDYRIYVEIADGRKGVFDMKPYLDRGIFRELRDMHYFSRVGIQLGAVTWPNEQDIAPETLLAEMLPLEKPDAFFPSPAMG